MKILLSSHFFHPSVGGIEQVSLTLANEFVKAGHELKVVTTTAEKSTVDFPFEVIRRPAPWKLAALVGWCDVYFHNNISLQTAWPLFFIRKPWVVSHHTWLTRVTGSLGIRDRIKRFVIRYATNISVSHAVAHDLSSPSIVIGNPYQDGVFKRNDSIAQTRDLVFLGRLVWDKGVDLLISAVSALKNKKMNPHLVVIGDGPELTMLEQQVQALDLKDHVEFLGVRTGDELVALLNAHRIIVIPSRWQEPFGLVALEGIACGCVPVGADCGGLTDAIGAAGIVFPCGEVQSMALSIEKLLKDETALAQYRAAAAEHLRNHHAEVVARKYLDVLEGAVR